MRLLIGVVVAIVASASPFAQQPGSAVHKMNDGFAYEVVDFGFGGVPYPFEPIVFRRRSLGAPVEKSALWIKLKITNLSERQLAVPKYSILDGAIDNARNQYDLQHRSITEPQAASRRYRPGESTFSLNLIPAAELIDGIAELRVVLGDTGGFGRGVKFFSLRNPQSRMRDFDPKADDPNPSTLPVEARSAFLPLLTPR